MLTSQTWEGGEFKNATVNFAVNESDDYTERDQVLDHVDCALVGLADFEQAYHILTRAFEELQHEVEDMPAVQLKRWACMRPSVLVACPT